MGEEKTLTVEPLAPSLEYRGGANRGSFTFQREVNIIRRYHRQKKRCIPAVQKGERFPCLIGGGIG
jgi:hypothetical protein